MFGKGYLVLFFNGYTGNRDNKRQNGRFFTLQKKVTSYRTSLLCYDLGNLFSLRDKKADLNPVLRPRRICNMHMVPTLALEVKLKMHSCRSLRTLFNELVGEDENYGQNLQTVYANCCALICKLNIFSIY